MTATMWNTDNGDAIHAQHKVGRLGLPPEVAATAAFLSSEDASFISGVALPVDGGYTAGYSQGLSNLDSGQIFGWERQASP